MGTMDSILRFFMAASVFGGFAALVLFPLGLIVRPIRAWCGVGVHLITGVWGVAIWLTAAIGLFLLWHWIGVFIGLVLLGIGVIPLAGIAFLVSGHFAALGYLVLSLVVVSVVNFLAYWMETR